jgi:hypothetical protein
MNPFLSAATVFICSFAGALGGLALRARMPDLERETRDVLTLVMGLVSTVTAMVLSLMITSSSAVLTTQDGEVQQLSARIVDLDRRLAHYGPETNEIRALLRAIVIAEVQRLWPPDDADGTALTPAPGIVEADDLYGRIIGLRPQSEMQRFAKDRALQTMGELAQIRLLMQEQATETIPVLFFGIMVFWLVALFTGFGLLARRNAVVVASLSVGALIVGCAIFLVIETRQCYTGLIQVSSAPMKSALAQMGR